MVVRIPPVATLEDDPHLLRETGRRLAEAYLKHPPLTVTVMRTVTEPSSV
jgi:hypothetical protein